ncbi:bag family molecular chaperone regulator 4 [Phtheirospermum japonicum]|uniref:Bag family molecular chaperone regulator 4 n=1 Tax=Phtheirospermum japonicum TaxID=374723 RepID=A0A830CNF1_9LAMI|nr:bag family molecular chaperone regulator 4 [Phtheirospermum japonicum]
MKSLNPSSESSRRNGVIGLGLMPNHGPATVNIKVSHGLDQYEVFVPSSSSFGYLKTFICQKVGLRPERHKLFFGGTEKDDDEDLQTAGVTDNSEVILLKAKANEQESYEEVPETSGNSKGEEAVAEVLMMQDLVDRGIKVEDKEVVVLTEMLMRQLLKLDGIEAEGEGRARRRAEVRRVQSLVETVDVLKSRNSNAFSNVRRSFY